MPHDELTGYSFFMIFSYKYINLRIVMSSSIQQLNILEEITIIVAQITVRTTIVFILLII